jgi:hypothetical protein
MRVRPTAVCDVDRRRTDRNTAEEGRHRPGRRHSRIEENRVEKEERPGEADPGDLAFDAKLVPGHRKRVPIVARGAQLPGEAIVNIGPKIVDIGPPVRGRILQREPVEPLGERGFWPLCAPTAGARCRIIGHPPQALHCNDHPLAPGGAILVVQHLYGAMAEVNVDGRRAANFDVPHKQPATNFGSAKSISAWIAIGYPCHGFSRRFRRCRCCSRKARLSELSRTDRGRRESWPRAKTPQRRLRTLRWMRL